MKLLRNQLCSPYRQDQVDLAEGKGLQLLRGKGSSSSSRGGIAVVRINNGAVIYADALAAGMLFYILESRLVFPGSVG